MQKLLKNLINLSLKQKISLLIIFSALFLITVFILNKTLFRYLVLSFIPLILTGYVFIKLQTRFKPLFLISGILIVAVLIHFRNTLFFSPTVYTDSNGYISWGRCFTQGLGFPGMWYRAPLYPFMLGCTFLTGSDNNLQLIVYIQRILTIADALIIYALATRWRLGTAASLMAAFLFSVNSLVIQMSHAIMTESVTLFLILLSILSMTYLFSKPTWISAVLCSISFTITAYCRQIASPLFFAGLVLFLIKSPRKRIALVLSASALFLLIEMPWSLRNLNNFGGYSLSYHLGPNIFTKLSSFRLEYKQGRYYSKCSEIVKKIEKNLGISDYTAPEYPEERWDINRIPHLLMDSLTQNHQYTPYTASRLLTKASIEGFLHNFIPYLKSVVSTMKSLLFEQHELPVNLQEVFPLTSRAPYALRVLLRTYAWVNGLFFLIVVLVLLFQREHYSSTRWLPWLLAFYGYVTTSLVQVGFSRYTVPWIPFMCMSIAYVSVRMCEYISIFLNSKSNPVPVDH